MALTDAERQRQSRERKAAQQARDWTPKHRLPERTPADVRHNEFAQRMYRWLEDADAEQVARYLVDALCGDLGRMKRMKRIAKLVTKYAAEA
jgi:hypothetical protein